MEISSGSHYSAFHSFNQSSTILCKMDIQFTDRDFPDGPVVKNPPSTAGDVGSIPGQQTKIPHVVG